MSTVRMARCRTRPRWALLNARPAAGTLTDARYIAVHDHVLPAVRVVVDGLLADQQARRHRLPDLVTPPEPDRRLCLTLGHAVGDEHREPDRLPRPDCAGRLHQRPAAGHHLVFRPGLQRVEAARTRVPLRAGFEGAASASQHACASWRSLDRSLRRGRPISAVERPRAAATPRRAASPSWRPCRSGRPRP